MSERILITGATGFVGAAVARRLQRDGHRLRLLVRPNADRRNLETLVAEIAEGNLQDADSLRAACQGCDSLFHVAADYRIWVPDPHRMHQINVEGTIALMRAAQQAGLRRIVYTSSVATLGCHADGQVANEETPSTLSDMIGPYKRTKYLAEEAVRDLVRAKGLPAVIVNPSTPIGPGDIKPTPTGDLIRKAAQGAVPAYVDTGLSLVHVDDVAEGHVLAWQKGEVGERYVLGGENIWLSRILAEIAALKGRPAPKTRLPRAPLYPLAALFEMTARLTGKDPLLTLDGLRMSKKVMFFSSAKAEQTLGYHYRPAREALRDAVAWFDTPGMARAA